MTTATGAGDDEVVEMEMDTESAPGPKGRFFTRGRALGTFLVLAVIAILALVTAILAIVLAPKNAITILWMSLVVLAVVIVAEVVILLVAKPGQA